jgi:hypothetical protein
MKRASRFAITSIVIVTGSLIGFGKFQAADTDTSPESLPRVTSGLVVLYDFASPSGDVVKDRSRAGGPIDLRIADLKAVRRTAGAIEVRGKTIIRSDKPASRLIDAVRRSGEITIEAWVRPANTKQDGPTRMVTLSKSTNERNFTLGQDADHLEVRLRTTKTTTNGVPAVTTASKTVATRLMHVVYTHDRAGRTTVYLDGKRVLEKTVAGLPTNWNETYQLALANELSNDRPWLGTFYLVAIYNRDLSSREVERNFKAGARASAVLAENRPSPQVVHFETRIAPLLAKHCLECHDTNSKKGRLDLSKKMAAFTGGESGKAIIPGKLSASLLWESVTSNEMPKKRPPLSATEKADLKQWIENGAVWSRPIIDPAIYTHEGGAGANWVQRLTLAEYIETVRASVGIDIGKEARKILPPDLRADGFSNTAYNLGVDLKHIDAYAKLAEMIVSRMQPARFAANFSKRNQLDERSMREVITRMGKQLLRGPLDSQEVDTYLNISKAVAKIDGNFNEAMAYIIEAMLQSPRFLYRIENHRGDGTAWPVGEYELASRLSYILWGGPPDEELMRAAGAGQLSDRRQLKVQVQRMLKDPRAVDRSSQFLSEWLNLDRLDNLKPDPKKFPNWNPKLAADMRAETLAFFEEIAWKQKRALADLLNAQVTFATPRLTTHYGFAAQGNGLTRYDVSKIPGRGGLLTQGSLLTIGGDNASMVTRGLFVLHDLLRGVVKDPPPCVDTKPIPTKPGLTQRGIAESRIANTSCGGCHSKFEPLAFGLEKFDGLGSYSEKDKHNNRLHDDGAILFPGQAKPASYKSSSELMNLLAESDRVAESLTWKVTQFALGRPLVAADAPILDTIHETARKAGGSYESLITAVVLSDLVRKTRTETNP